MSYALGIDLGTTFTAAAVQRNGTASIVDLGSRSPVIPSVVFVREDGTTLVGEPAVRRAAGDPGRVAREFKRRIGDPTPILLGGAPWSAEALLARLLRWTVESVTEREGDAPASVAVTHPANWGPYKFDLLTQAVRLAEVRVDRYLTEPEAAAYAYAATERLPAGQIVAVYDLGGGTFDATVLCKTPTGFRILGEPEGIERLGGIDFDQAVFSHVVGVLGAEAASLDPTDPSVLTSLAHLRSECIDAKEALSADTDATIAVLLPTLQTEVRLTRAEFETLIRPPLAETVAALHRALRSAGVQAADLGAVLLVGGSSRIPLVAELITEELGRPVSVDTHPKHVVALGASLAAPLQGASAARPSVPEERVVDVDADAAAASRADTTAPPPARLPVAAAVGVAPSPPLAPVSVAAAATHPVATASAEAPEPAPPIADRAAPPSPPTVPIPGRSGNGSGPDPASPRRSRRLAAGVSAVIVVALVAVGAIVLFGGDEPGTAAAGAGITACPDGPSVCIEDVEIQGDRILASFTAHGAELAGPVDGRFPAGTVHPLFFFDGTGASQGRIWGPSSPFGGESALGLEGFGPADAPASSTSLCVLLQDAAGNVLSGTGNCATLP